MPISNTDITKVPAVQRIVYSTCSIHAIENEHVVRAALESAEARDANIQLAPRNAVIPTWHRRGLPSEMDKPGGYSNTMLSLKWLTMCSGDAESLIRCSPDEDGTNGFFVSCFIRQTVISDDQIEAEVDSRDERCLIPESGKRRAPSLEPSRRTKKKKKRKVSVQ